MTEVQEVVTEVNGVSRKGMRWGDDGKVYLCTPDGDCSGARDKAQAWAEKQADVTELPPEPSEGAVLSHNIEQHNLRYPA